MHLSLQPGTELDELRPVTDQLPRLPDRRRSDPHLANRPAAPLASLPQQIDGPIPAVGGLDHDFAVRAGATHHLEQPEGIVLDPDAVDLSRRSVSIV